MLPVFVIQDGGPGPAAGFVSSLRLSSSLGWVSCSRSGAWTNREFPLTLCWSKEKFQPPVFWQSLSERRNLNDLTGLIV